MSIFLFWTGVIFYRNDDGNMHVTSEFVAKIEDNLCHDELIHNSGIVGGEISSRRKDLTRDGKYIKLYPNPAEDIISFEQDQESETSLIVIDINGNIVKRETISGLVGQIDLSVLTGGVYVFHFTSSKHTTIKRVVVQ